jgi:multisubunit Na+/H+ antiporter MnhE subunit
MRSEVILAQVVNALGSNETQGNKQLGTQERPDLAGRIAQLKTHIEVRPVPNTNMMDVRVRSEDPEEAAQIANALAETYRAYPGKLLGGVPALVPSPFKAEVMGRALTVGKSERLKLLLEVARHASGAMLFGVAAGAAAVWVVFRRRRPRATDVLPWLFVIVFFVVLGGSVLNSQANLAVTTAAGLLLAFVVGGVANWFVFLRKRYPETPNVFPAVFITAFLLAVGVGILDAAFSAEWYCSTARLRLRPTVPDRAGLATAPGGYAVYDPQLIKTQCDVIRSENTLRPVIHDLDLNRLWGARYSDGTPLQTSWTLAALRRRMEVRRVPDTCLIEVRVFSEKADEAARLANGLVETYREHLRDHLVAFPQDPTAIQAEFLDHAVPAARAWPHYQLAQLISYASIGLCLAFAAGGGALWVASELVKARQKASDRRFDDKPGTGQRPDSMV